jgi:conjugal transfer pilus assembly protein TraV
MEATNNHDDLKYLKKEGDVGKQDIADSQYPTTLTPPPGVQYPKKPVVNTGPKPLFSGTPQPVKPLTTASYVSQQHVPAGKGLYSEFDGKPVNPTLSAYQERQYQCRAPNKQ